MMTISETARQQFVKELQMAMSVDDVREIYIDAAPRIVPSDGFGLYEFKDNPLEVPVEMTANLSDTFMQKYEALGRADDPVLEFLLDHMLPGDSSRLDPDRWLASSACDLLAEEGLEHSLEAPLTASGKVVGTINFARSTGTRSFADEDVTSARFISEHLSLAMERARRIQQLGERAAVLEGALERSPQGVIVTDLEGRTLYGNRQAAEMLSEERLRGSRLAERVDAAIREFIASERHAATVNVQDTLTRRRVAVKSHRDVRRDAVVSLVYELADAEETTLPVWGVLSPREQEIATLVSQGMTTREIASRAFISENTVKQHLKRIFAKTGVHSRAELVQTIWSSRPST